MKINEKTHNLQQQLDNVIFELKDHRTVTFEQTSSRNKLNIGHYWRWLVIFSLFGIIFHSLDFLLFEREWCETHKQWHLIQHTKHEPHRCHMEHLAGLQDVPNSLWSASTHSCCLYQIGRYKHYQPSKATPPCTPDNKTHRPSLQVQIAQSIPILHLAPKHSPPIA